MKTLQSLLILSSIGIAALSFGNVQSVTFAHTSAINGGATGIAMGTITLVAPAPVGGVDVSISDVDNSGLIDFGGVTSVHFNEGEQTNDFAVTAPVLVSSSTPVNIAANDGGTSAQGVLTVNPLRANKLILGEPALQGNSISVTIALNGPTLNDLVIDLSASTGLTFESNQVTVLAGQRSTTAIMDISPTAPQTGNTLTATIHLSGVAYTRTAFSTIPLRITILTADSTVLSSGQSTIIHVTLSGAVSQNTTLTVGGATYLTTGTVTIPAGASSVNVSVTAKTTTRIRTEALRLTTPNGKSKALTFTINP